MPLQASRLLVEPADECLPILPLCGRILVADDNRDGLDALVALLSAEGYSVYAAHDGLEALKMLETVSFDVAVLDISMPGLDGFGVAERIRKSQAMDSVRLIAMTGFDGINDKSHAFCAGFDHYLTKPVSMDALKPLLSTS